MLLNLENIRFKWKDFKVNFLNCSAGRPCIFDLTILVLNIHNLRISQVMKLDVYRIYHFKFCWIVRVTLFHFADEKTERVSVELILVKLTHKKRKEATSPYVQSPLGSTEIQVNPSEDHPPSKAPALSIPSESFNLANGHHIKTCSLLVRVHHTPLSQVNGKYWYWGLFSME